MNTTTTTMNATRLNNGQLIANTGYNHAAARKSIVATLKKAGYKVDVHVANTNSVYVSASLYDAEINEWYEVDIRFSSHTKPIDNWHGLAGMLKAIKSLDDTTLEADITTADGYKEVKDALVKFVQKA